MTKQNKKMYYLFSIAADLSLMWTLSTQRVWLYHFFACAAHGSLHLRAAVQTMFTVHTYTIHFHQREKEKHVFVLLLNSSHFIKS